jgi:L-iditol 2-dehydrogenase
MKAMVLRAVRDLGLEEVLRPEPSFGEILIRMGHSSLCGTDLKIFTGAIPAAYPRIMGHELVGQVDGAGSEAFPPGTRVIIDPQLYCGVCFHCRIGQTHLCPRGQLLGRDRNGGFAEYVTVPLSHIFRLPDSIGIQTAPMIQVLTTCVHAQRRVDIFPGESVVVLGLGVTGQLHVQLAKLRGARVIGITRSGAKRDLAERLGADLTLIPGPAGLGRVLDATEGRGADVVIETTGATSSLSDAVAMARSGGRLLLFGIFTATDLPLPLYQLYFKELAVLGTRVAKSEDYPAAIDLVDRNVVQLEPLVSDVIPLHELGGAIARLASGEASGLKIVVQH